MDTLHPILYEPYPHVIGSFATALSFIVTPFQGAICLCIAAYCAYRVVQRFRYRQEMKFYRSRAI